jgi:hypothetical protein
MKFRTIMKSREPKRLLVVGPPCPAESKIWQEAEDLKSLAKWKAITRRKKTSNTISIQNTT